MLTILTYVVNSYKIQILLRETTQLKLGDFQFWQDYNLHLFCFLFAFTTVGVYTFAIKIVKTFNTMPLFVNSGTIAFFILYHTNPNYPLIPPTEKKTQKMKNGSKRYRFQILEYGVIGKFRPRCFLREKLVEQTHFTNSGQLCFGLNFNCNSFSLSAAQSYNLTVHKYKNNNISYYNV